MADTKISALPTDITTLETGDKFAVADVNDAGVNKFATIDEISTFVQGSVVPKSLFDANSILAANSDDTPAAVTVGEQTVVGRITSGNITALSVAQLQALIGYMTVEKTVDETVNNSVDFQDDDHLTLAVGASDKWALEYHIRYSSGTTPDIKFTFSVPASGWMYIVTSSRLGPATDGATGTTITSFGNADTIAIAGAGAGAERQLIMWATYYGGGTAGNVTLRWAQNTQNASDTIVYSRSYILAHKIG